MEEKYYDDDSVAVTDPDNMASSLEMEEKPVTMETEKKLNSAGT